MSNTIQIDPMRVVIDTDEVYSVFAGRFGGVDPRAIYPDHESQEVLRASLDQHGFRETSPITVTQMSHPETGVSHYVIVDGRQRVIASRALHLPHVWATVESFASPWQYVAMSESLNAHRPTNPWDRAVALRRMVQCGATEREVLRVYHQITVSRAPQSAQTDEKESTTRAVKAVRACLRLTDEMAVIAEIRNGVREGCYPTGSHVVIPWRFARDWVLGDRQTQRRRYDEYVASLQATPAKQSKRKAPSTQPTRLSLPKPAEGVIKALLLDGDAPSEWVQYIHPDAAVLIQWIRGELPPDQMDHLSSLLPEDVWSKYSAWADLDKQLQLKG